MKTMGFSQILGLQRFGNTIFNVGSSGPKTFKTELTAQGQEVQISAMARAKTRSDCHQPVAGKIPAFIDDVPSEKPSFTADVPQIYALPEASDEPMFPLQPRSTCIIYIYIYIYNTHRYIRIHKHIHISMHRHTCTYIYIYTDYRHTYNYIYVQVYLFIQLSKADVLFVQRYMYKHM